jgi:hypothetical protein
MICPARIEIEPLISPGVLAQATVHVARSTDVRRWEGFMGIELIGYSSRGNSSFFIGFFLDFSAKKISHILYKLRIILLFFQEHEIRELL